MLTSVSGALIKETKKKNFKVKRTLFYTFEVLSAQISI